jgi:hypothetical protein
LLGGAHHGAQDRCGTRLTLSDKRTDVPHVADCAVPRVDLRDLGELLPLQEGARGHVARSVGEAPTDTCAAGIPSLVSSLAVSTAIVAASSARRSIPF